MDDKVVDSRWSQTVSHVSVSLLLGSCSPADISLEWSERDCNLETKDGRSWSCQWSNEIVPTISKARLQGQHLVLKLAKAEQGKEWKQLQKTGRYISVTCYEKDNATVPLPSVVEQGSPAPLASCQLIDTQHTNHENHYQSSVTCQDEENEQIIFDSMSDIAKSVSAMVKENDSLMQCEITEGAAESTAGCFDEKRFSAESAEVLCNLPETPCTAGIKNLGYTCFMSSIVQCLAHCQELRDYVLRDYYQSDVNLCNPLGFKGELVKQFASIIRRLWCKDLKCINPRKLLRVFRSRLDHFNDSAQHDAQEFMNFLLDGLHEDLNRIRIKPVTSAVEADGRPDEVVAKEMWLMHRRWNDSVICDLFQGQFKSIVCCPQCQHVSVTFDPFLQISVPLPKQHRIVSVVFMPRQHRRKLSRFAVRVLEDSSVEDLLKLVAQKANVTSDHSLLIFEVLNGVVHRLFRRKDSVLEIQQGELLVVTDGYCTSSDEQSVLIRVYQTLAHGPLPTVCSSCKRDASGTATQLQRCGHCFQVAYCSKHCQTVHWDNGHRLLCGRNRRYIGIPFVFTLPASQATYRQICVMCDDFARRSVVARPMDERGMQCTQECKDFDKQFSLRPVNRLGDYVVGGGSTPLRDRGGDPAVFQEHICLAMEWQNNVKKPHCVSIRERERTEFIVNEDDEIQTDDVVTLDQCLRLFTAPEHLTKTDAWYCSKCKEHTLAKKQIEIWRLPHILIFHLKRFKYSGNMWRDKISCFVDFPERCLDMRPYLADGEAGDLPTVYDLFGVVYHYGAVFGGHYIAAARFFNWKSVESSPKDFPEFYEYDDELVQPLFGSPIKSFAYVLFYRRRGDFQIPISNELRLSMPGLDNDNNKVGEGTELEVTTPSSVEDQFEQSKPVGDRDQTAQSPSSDDARFSEGTFISAE